MRTLRHGSTQQGGEEGSGSRVSMEWLPRGSGEARKGTTAQEAVGARDSGLERVWGIKTGRWAVACVRLDLHLTAH
jgi:hypothetical protein